MGWKENTGRYNRSAECSTARFIDSGQVRESPLEKGTFEFTRGRRS